MRLGLNVVSRNAFTPIRVRAPAQARPAVAAISRGSRQIQLRATAEAKKESKKKEEEDSDSETEEVYDGPDVAPSNEEIAAFLNTLCNETTIAQVQLKLGNFSLHVRRSLEPGSAAAGPAPVPAAPAAAPAPAPSAFPTVTVLTSGEFSPEESIDEALTYVTANKVGIFRRGKYAANKRVGKGNVVSVGDTLKGGQVVGYVEQLGTFHEVATAHGGEAVRFKVEEGDPVEYGQVVLEVAPFFGSPSPVI